MNPNQTPETNEVSAFELTSDSAFKKHFCHVTPLSKYLAMALFVLLPFVGAYLGYQFAPEKVVEVERVVEKEINLSNNEDELKVGEEKDTTHVVTEDAIFNDSAEREKLKSEYVFSREPYTGEYMSDHPLFCQTSKQNIEDVEDKELVENGLVINSVLLTLSDKCGLFEYNSETELYDIEHIDSFGSFVKEYGDTEGIGYSGIKILPSFSGEDRVYFSQLLWEGGGLVPLSYIDLFSLESGFQSSGYKVDGLRSLSPDKSKFFALNDKNNIFVIDTKTFEVEPVSLSGDRCVAWSNIHSGGTDRVEISWKSDDILEVIHFYQEDCFVDVPAYEFATDDLDVQTVEFTF